MDLFNPISPKLRTIHVCYDDWKEIREHETTLLAC
jgi:hypothetical protein